MSLSRPNDYLLWLFVYFSLWLWGIYPAQKCFRIPTKIAACPKYFCLLCLSPSCPPPWSCSRPSSGPPGSGSQSWRQVEMWCWQILQKCQRWPFPDSYFAVLLKRLGDCPIMLILVNIDRLLLFQEGALSDFTLYDKESCSLERSKLKSQGINLPWNLRIVCPLKT